MINIIDSHYIININNAGKFVRMPMDRHGRPCIIYNIIYLYSYYIININNAGKFVRMPMDRHGRIVGGFIDHYLLEKSRVTHQACLCI